jgi:uncharacterized protein YfaS (alpha-2-macroglobulin family)
LNFGYAQSDTSGARIEKFSPQGTVKNVRQVTARFSEQMVPFGEPRLVEPFDIKCPEKGRARWIDGKSWSYDFDRDLPAGVVCEFILKGDIKTLSGKEITGQNKFSFSTGGPAIKESYPYEGSEDIDENQIFILTLDTEPKEDSIISNVFFSIEGVNERVGVRILKGEEREKILKISVRNSDKNVPRVLIQSKQSFPNKLEVSLIWAKGVKSLSGVKTTEDQMLNFKTRDSFTAKFNCERENPKAKCIPILPMSLDFSAPVSWEYAGNIILKGSNNKVYAPSKLNEGEEKAEFVSSISFKGPFPENTSFTIEIPKDIKDDARRSLTNLDKFPLTVKTDAYPPLAKFSARFGIIELKEGMLPVTLRNLEPRVKARMHGFEKKKEGVFEKVKQQTIEQAIKIGESINSVLPDSIRGKGKGVVEGLKVRLYKIQTDKDEEIIEWLRRVATTGRKRSIFKDEPNLKGFSIPKPGGSKAFELVGIPLKAPGFYVVEIQSEILGASLLGEPKPVYVPTAALVTNLSAHFKWGRESSLVWVTTLDKGEPVNEASITVRDCKGNMLWRGKTDQDGIAYIKKQLPLEKELPGCELNRDEDVYYDSPQLIALDGLGKGLFITAKTSDDMTFVHSSWDNGIEPWRYNLPSASEQGSIIADTIFDRSLLRAGETVHMKHIIREHTMSGFSMVGGLPKAVLIRHQGSDQKYEFPLNWGTNGVAETDWKIPPDAKIGIYEVFLSKKATDKAESRTADEEGNEGYYNPDGWTSGSFRVEEFRVPLMKGIIQPPKDPLVNASQVNVDIILTYLSGGGAWNATVKLRSQIQPRYINFEDYEDFTFANGEVKEGIFKRSSYEDEGGGIETTQGDEQKPKIESRDLVLDKAGALRTKITNLPRVSLPQDILTELEFIDPNGEVQTVSTRIPLWPSKLLVGIKPDSWAASKDSFKFQAVVLDLSGSPVSNAPVKVDLLQRKYYSHRKRLVGGFYSYENITEIKSLGSLCEGRTDPKGLLICAVKSPVSGNVILQAKTVDDAGNISVVNRDVWVAGGGEWWFDVSDNDRIDLLPEKKRYEPGETAKFQVRMPFREATALITIEREGIIEASIKKLSGKMPAIEVPIKNNYAPNVFVSALVVRGRVSDIQPTAIVDLGRPAFKLGISEIRVGWKAHELKVKVSTDKNVYKIREKMRVKVEVKTAYGETPPKGSEAAIAAVDEGLLELSPNESWKLLDAMMGRREYEVRTSTAQMQVVGKRHYGLKALPQGGGGGKQITRELFDTLLFWKASEPLNEKGEAYIEIPLNDSLTSFKIVAVANGGLGLFGTGDTSVRTTQDLMILAGIPPFVREGDKFKAGFTVRNASNRKMSVELKSSVKENKEKKDLIVITEPLQPGEAKEVGWEINTPYGVDSLIYEVIAKEINGEASDTLKVKENVVEAIPTRIFQATLTQIKNSFNIDVEKPKDSLPGRGGINVSLRPKLSNGLAGVVFYMKQYPYMCMEQKVSKAVALRDGASWKNIMAEMPSYLDSDGLVKYFPIMNLGSDVLTSYILSISNEAKYEIPSDIKNRMMDGLRGFIEGRVVRYSSLPTADLSMRKMAALEALSRNGSGEPNLLSSISIEPNLWPTSAVIDWMNVLLRIKGIRDHDKKLKEAEQIIRPRLNLQGTTMSFSTESTDYLWWLMVSSDENTIKGLLTLLAFEDWKEDIPRLARGVIGRLKEGHWDTTVANAWGTLSMERFSEKFESVAVTGSTNSTLDKRVETVEWSKYHDGKSIEFNWPQAREKLSIAHQGSGNPWATIQSLAAIPLKESFSSGYKIKKTLIPVEQKVKEKWSRGDVVRVRLELEAQADMTWVVVNDPIPAGSSILGTGLQRDSQLLTTGEKREGWVWPSFEERSFRAFRAYYEYVPKGKWTVEYTVRLNNEGVFDLPPSRVEALYSPEMMGELPNDMITVE